MEKKRGYKARLHEIIFEADTVTGKRFDVILLVFIMISVVLVLLESVDELNKKYHDIFYYGEWVFTIIFTIEYFIRLYVVKKPLKYATSFFGIIDLLAIVPTYLGMFFIGGHYLLSIRVLRMIRVFRVFKLVRFLRATNALTQALKASRPKIVVFLTAIFLLVIVIGSVMYLIEGNANSGFDSIPNSIYWAIVTLTTVGYGDITPVTSLGRTLSAFIMILGYSIIAVPTGIVTSQMTSISLRKPTRVNSQVCRDCGNDEHEDDAQFCKKCGFSLDD